MRKLKHFFLFILFIQFSLFCNALSLNDVSLLYPLPEPHQWSLLLNTTEHPFLLPKALFDKIPFLINQHNDRTYPQLHVVGIRFDPCFVEGQPPYKCQAQVRLIWQPLKIKNEKTITVDASLHTFFHFSNDEFSELIRNLKLITTNSFSDSNQPLGINPSLQREGLGGNFSNKLKHLLVNQLQHKSVERITFMKLKGVDDIWIFGGLNKIENQYEPIEIPRLSKAIQQDFVNSMSLRPNPTKFLGGIFPSPNPESTLDVLTRDSNLAQELTENEILTLVKNLAEIDHPQKFNPGTADCVTCHLSNTVNFYIFKEFAQFNPEAFYFENRYQNSNFNLDNQSKRKGQTNILRMFGYFEDEPIVSQRTINETAEAVSLIKLIK